MGLVGEAVGLTAAGSGAPADADEQEGPQDRLVVEAAEVAVAAGSPEIVSYLSRLAQTRDLGADAMAAVVVAASEVALAAGDWDLVQPATGLEAGIGDEEARDDALLALAWAHARRAAEEREPGAIREGSVFAHRMTDKPRKAMAFAFLADAARQLDLRDLLDEMVEEMDGAMVGTGGPSMIEGYCRVALAFRLDGFGRQVLAHAHEAAESTSSFGGMGLAAKDREEATGVFAFLTARYFAWIARTAVELNEPSVAGPALEKSLELILKVDPAMSMMLSVTMDPFLESIEYVDDTKTQQGFLVAMRDFANRIPEPFGRSMVLASVSETAQRIATAQGSPELRLVAFQSATAIPLGDVRKEQLVDISYVSGRLRDPGFVSERLSAVWPEDDPELELRVLAAALEGLAESDDDLRPHSSRFYAETHLTAD